MYDKRRFISEKIITFLNYTYLHIFVYSKIFPFEKIGKTERKDEIMEVG